MRLILLFFVCLSYSLQAQYTLDSLLQYDEKFKTKVGAYRNSIDLFGSDSILNVTISSDFKNLVKRKYKDEYQPATFSIAFNDTVQIIRKVKIKTRGNNRLSSCHFPPIKINFDKDDVFIKSLKEFDKIKMVNNCRMQEAYEKYVLSEYLIYKMYNQVSEFSFRVRLLRITYINEGRKNSVHQSYAFLIEPEDQIESRLNGFVIDKTGLPENLMNQNSENRLALFQFIIGNTDYSIPSNHNMAIFKINDPLIERPLLIPFDFDYSGLVNTPYAIPHESLGISNTRDRLFLGGCQAEKVFQSNIQYLDSKKESMYSLINESPYFEEKYRLSMIDFLQESFELLENPKMINNVFRWSCED